MAALVEVHDRRELDMAIAAGSGHHRREQSQSEHLRGDPGDVAAAGRSTCRPGVVRVSESGIHDAARYRPLRAAGYNAFLVGEHLMKSGDPAAALEKLVAA